MSSGGRRDYMAGESPTPRRPSKYRAVATAYAGVRYASKAEAHRAMELDLLLKAGEIVEWIAQPTVRLGVPENVYRPDFLVVASLHRLLGTFGTPIRGGQYGDETLPTAWYEDTKGVETPKFRRDKKLWKAYGRLPLHLIRGGKTVEIITPDGRD